MTNNFETENARQYPLLDDTQLTELERRLSAAEQEIARQLCKPHIERTPIIADFEFKAAEYVRRLIEDVKHYRAVEAENAKLKRAVDAALSGEEGDQAAVKIENARMRQMLEGALAWMSCDTAADALRASITEYLSRVALPPSTDKLAALLDFGDIPDDIEMREIELAALKYERALASPSAEQSAKTEYNRLDIRAIAREQLQRMKEAGESHEMCARWISEAVNAALA